MIGTWTCTLPNGGTAEELVVRHDTGSAHRVLVIPPLFGEHNLMRRQLVEVMRRLAEANVDSVLPDLPGWNESLAPLENQTLTTWRAAMTEAARAHDATAVLAVRSGTLLVPQDLGGWLYAPQSGSKLLRAMLRARTIASREAGRTETTEELTRAARDDGIVLAGWSIGATMFRELEQADLATADKLGEISQGEVGGAGLWLRAEPDYDPDQGSRLANIVAEGIAASGVDEA